MKFVKSKFAQKLIIILIVLLIFNIAIPKQVHAWDIAGILFKPIFSLILSVLVSIDCAIGVTLNGISIAVDGLGGLADAIAGGKGKNMSDSLSKLFIGPDTIFAGKVMILNANIFKTVNITDMQQFEGLQKSIESITDAVSDVTSPGYYMIITIREALAEIYIVLRNICAYIMLAGLLYTGIRVLISSNNPQKQAQWKSYVFDWLVGMILLIFSHVIMVGIFTISDLLVEALATETNGFGGINFQLICQCVSSYDGAEQMICLIMLGYLICLTIVYAMAYLKRFMWVCILIVIAPVVSVMYTFGNQTKQIYHKWLREFLTTVLIQPFHIIIYYILVSIPLNIVNSTGGFSLSSSSVLELIYALAAMKFIKPAEKYVRSLFGMDQGVARMASYESGKKTLNDMKRVVQRQKEKVAETGTKVMTVAGAVVGGYFGGPQGAQMGAKLGKSVGKQGEKQAKEKGNKQEYSDAVDNGGTPKWVQGSDAMPSLRRWIWPAEKE